MSIPLSAKPFQHGACILVGVVIAIHAWPQTKQSIVRLEVGSVCPNAEYFIVFPPNSPGLDENEYSVGALITVYRVELTCSSFFVGWTLNGIGLPATNKVEFLAYGNYMQLMADHLDPPCFCPPPDTHSADYDKNFRLSLSEVLRIIQFYNANAFHCDVTSEDGYAPGVGEIDCQRHSSDYAPKDWKIDLSEVLRVIQFYNSLGIRGCSGSEDGYCLFIPDVN